MFLLTIKDETRIGLSVIVLMATQKYLNKIILTLDQLLSNIK
jgi:hypothetical protein